MSALTQQQKDQFVDFLFSVQKRLLKAFEDCDGSAKAERKTWQRPEDQGGGTMGVLRGSIVEKAGCNVSAVSGKEYPAIEGEYKGKPFWAAGVSTITHMFNPNAPIAHMNVRCLEVGDTFWMGGGADLTPFKIFDDDTKDFHKALEAACSIWGDDSYERYKKWCDEYFFIPHRQSPRGVGGIFFDYLKGDFTKLKSFLERVTDAYIDVYPKILERRKAMPFNDEEKEGQLYWRGRYAEFNLAWDRGTRFGLMTGGNTEAIFVSLPPVVKW
ncbi:MAG: oxygen-dependent coproporphyrinogen oxidase [Proteobacteria bacterium]|nr:oxygen-dependent coproporphyrinogen oxidase [Pseudomonadota bacterium]